MHRVALSSSGIITDSIGVPVREGKRYFLVPSADVISSRGAYPPTSKWSASLSLELTERLLI